MENIWYNSVDENHHEKHACTQETQQDLWNLRNELSRWIDREIVDAVRQQIAQTYERYNTAEEGWESFLLWHQELKAQKFPGALSGKYKGANESLKDLLADQRRAINDLKLMLQEQTKYLKLKVKEHYAKDPQKAKILMQEIDAFDGEINQLNTFLRALERLFHQRKWQLMQMHPYVEYSDKRKERAKKKAENGREKDRRNAMQYFGWWPISENDKGKCNFTDATIEKNKRIKEEVMNNAKDRSERKESDESPLPEVDSGLRLPDFASGLQALLEKKQQFLDAL